MKKSSLQTIYFLLAVLFSNIIFAQKQIKGVVLDIKNKPVTYAVVSIKGTNINTYTNHKGEYNLNDVEQIINIKIFKLGYKSIEKRLDVSKNSVFNFTLKELYENLNTVVVTGTFDERTQLESSTSTSVLTSNQLDKIVSKGTADLLRNVPGTFIDASAGEVFTKVYSRGVSASAEDDLGWYYTSLQEDGLPVSLIQHSYYGPDLFYRNDITTSRVEAIRGGSASITAMNAPGGIYNFISLNKTKSFGGKAQLTSGVQGDNNLYNKLEFALHGNLENDWFYNIGGHYRNDEGARNVDFTFSEGGQIKLNFIKKNDFGYFKIYGKVLHDKTNRWNGVTASNWNNPTAAFGQNFNTTSQLLPSINATIPDGRYLDEQKSNSFDPSQGVLVKDFVVGFDFSQTLANDWTVKNNIKISNKSANWQTSISNAFVSLNNPLAYFITGADFPIGKIVFNDANTGNELAQLGNSGVLVGQSSIYTNGKLPNDGLLGVAGWFKDTKSTEVMDHLVFNKKWQQHNLNTGIDFGYADMKHYTQSSFIYATYENNPKALVVTLENPGTDVIALSDEHGVSNYGGLFFENTSANLYQTALFINDLWDVTDELQLDAGIRFETISHQGNKYRSEPFSQNGGYDGNSQTDYDNGILQSNGTNDQFNFEYNYLSYSIGVNYKLEENLNVFTRYSKGNKAPEFDYYFNNFGNVPVPKKGEIQEVYQSEVGVKYNSPNMFVTGTAFLSELNNIGTTDFEFDEGTNTIFYTPTQFNSSRTYGFEFESMYKPLDFLRFNLNGVYQNAKSKDWTLYNTQGTSETTDDEIVNYNNQKLPYNPDLMFNFKTTFEQEAFYAFLDFQYMGERQGNIANGFTLPSYYTFNFGTGYAFNSSLNLSANITNLFNSDGLAGFYGPNSFGASSNDVTPEYVVNNPDQNFIVVPILPRGMFLKLNYQF